MTDGTPPPNFNQDTLRALRDPFLDQVLSAWSGGEPSGDAKVDQFIADMRRHAEKLGWIDMMDRLRGAALDRIRGESLPALTARLCLDFARGRSQIGRPDDAIEAARVATVFADRAADSQTAETATILHAVLLLTSPARSG